MPVKKPSRFHAFLGPRSVALVILSIAAVGVLIIASQPSPIEVSAAVVQPRELAPVPSEATTTAKPRVPVKSAAARTGATRTAALDTPTRSTTPVTATSAPAVLPASRAAAVDSVAKAVAQASDPVTITGCLIRDDETFKLKDTEGEETPKARSWKSGFLRKKAASIDLVDATNRLKLDTHVGERVSVRGMLVEREMQARSLQRVAESCD